MNLSMKRKWLCSQTQLFTLLLNIRIFKGEMECNVIFKSFDHLVKSCSENLEISSLCEIHWNAVDNIYNVDILKNLVNFIFKRCFFVIGPFYFYKSYNSLSLKTKSKPQICHATIFI